ncbi:hypothetical protein NKI45_24330, partial [Mesorhizobium sp. M0619]
RPAHPPLQEGPTHTHPGRAGAPTPPPRGGGPPGAPPPNQIADQLQDWFEAGAADGFNLMFPLLPEDWVNFAEQVVPELQRRGVFPTEYAPGTLRDRFGLARPANRFTEQRDNVRAVS